MIYNIDRNDLLLKHFSNPLYRKCGILLNSNDSLLLLNDIVNRKLSSVGYITKRYFIIDVIKLNIE